MCHHSEGWALNHGGSCSVSLWCIHRLMHITYWYHTMKGCFSKRWINGSSGSCSTRLGIGCINCHCTIISTTRFSTQVPTTRNIYHKMHLDHCSALNSYHRCTNTPYVSVRETKGAECGEEGKTNHPLPHTKETSIVSNSAILTILLFPYSFNQERCLAFLFTKEGSTGRPHSSTKMQDHTPMYFMLCYTFATKLNLLLFQYFPSFGRLR